MAAVVSDSPCYVTVHKSTFELTDLTTRGKPKPTGRLVPIHKHELREVLWWGEGIVGVAERMFPHPKDWRLGDIYKPLDRILVRDLTRCFTERLTKPPNCLAAWDKRLPGIHWRTLLARYKPGLATPKDFGSHFKLILHRAMFTNPNNPQSDTALCRVCNKERESILHFGRCQGLKPIFEFMRTFDGGTDWDDARMNLFGVNDMMGVIPEGTSTLHFMLWKHTLIQLTMKALKGEPVSPLAIIDKATLRVLKRVKALEYEIRCEYCKSEARETAPKLGKFKARIEGIGNISDEGRVYLHEKLKEIIELNK